MILVAEYDPGWPVRFEQLHEEYAAAMAGAGVPVVAIEHVGSTSVPGLAAKPVIDCDIVVAEPDVAAASQVLAGLGFRPEGDLGIPLRWAFKEPDRLAGTNTYVIVAGSLSLRNHLAVRGILRSDPVLREEYAAVKRRVGAVAANIDEYGQGKSAVIQQILAAAGLTEAERASINANQVPSHDEVPRQSGHLPSLERPGVTMSDRPFDDGFISELGAILRSTVSIERFDSAGNSTGITTDLFTGEWVLRTLEFEPGSGRTRVTCHFAARDGDRDVMATIDAGDFQQLIGKRSRDPAFNSSRYSDLAVLVSVYIEEQILSYDPTDLAVDVVRIPAWAENT